MISPPKWKSSSAKVKSYLKGKWSWLQWAIVKILWSKTRQSLKIKIKLLKLALKLNEPLCERAFGRTQGFHAKFTVGKYRTNRKGDTQIQISNSDFDQDFRSTSAWWRSSVSAGFLTEVFLTVIVKSKETKQINKKWRNIILYETLLRLPVGPYLQASCIVCA